MRTTNREFLQLLSQNYAKRYLPRLLVFGAYFLLGLRFFRLISQYSVNVLFSDQWDIDDATLFQHHSIWEMFRWQHGPHRQGLGALWQKLIEPSIHWNSRYEAFGIGAIIVIAALLALLLKVRLYGAIAYSDVIIPLLFFTPLQYETLVITANPAHGPLPSLLIVLYCLCWLVRPYWWKYSCILLVNFLLLYTGFGIFVGPVTPVLLALDYGANVRHLAPRYKWGHAAAIAIAMASLGSFFVGYEFQSAVDCFSPAPKNPVLYPWFVALMFANAAGLRTLSLAPATLAGSILLLFLLVGLAFAARRLLAQNTSTWGRDAAIATLLAYCAIFSFNTAYGRLCLGIGAAASSRYVPYAVLGFFGLYLYALSNDGRKLRASLVFVVFVLAMLSARPLDRVNAGGLEYVTSGKRIWRQCYLARHDLYECDAQTHFQVYPRPDATNLQQKLDFLEQNRLNLYDDSQ